MTPIRLFVGYDPRLPFNYHVFMHSLMKHASLPVSVTPLVLNHLKAIWHREKTPDQLTDFSYTRFLVPSLCQFQGWAIFMDGTDMMLRDDIAKLWAMRDDNFDLMLVKHSDIKENHSFLNKTISTYPMFNWSSLMIFNNEKCKQLSNAYVHEASYHDLHQFKWLGNLDHIGALPMHWNHLVGYHPPINHASLVHWTQQAPSKQHKTNLSPYELEWHALANELAPE